MRKILILCATVSLVVSAIAQQEAHDVSVINIEIPVRAFEGNKFVETLNLEDFEVFEDGVLQKIDAVYLIKKTSITREEGKKRFTPEVSRNFILFFEITEFLPRIVRALDYFFENVILPGDELTIVTPVKTYNLKARALEVKSKEEILDQLKGILRRDALVGSAEYRSSIEDLKRIVASISAAMRQSNTQEEQEVSVEGYSAEYDGLPLDEQIQRYSELLDKMESIRLVNQKKLIGFSDYLKERGGQKYVFMFYQREFIPKIDTKIMDQYMYLYQGRPDIIHSLTGLFDFYKRSITFDVEKVKQSFADAAIAIHFLFLTKPPENIYGIKMEEQSEDIYSAFREMAQATGGYADSSQNAEAVLKDALEAAENYYLIYYTPANYKKDGKFRKIEVKIKGRNYRITHRSGYFSN